MISNADIPMTTVDFQVDTLKDEPRAASYFLPQKGTITANYSTESQNITTTRKLPLF